MGTSEADDTVDEKAAKGIVVRSWEGAEEYSNLAPNAEVLCSEVVNFVSEWRYFVRYRELVGSQYYYGDEKAECNRSVIECAVK